MTAVNPNARDAAVRCLEAGMPLFVPPNNPSGDAGVDVVNAYASVQKTPCGFGAGDLYQTAFPCPDQEKAR